MHVIRVVPVLKSNCQHKALKEIGENNFLEAAESFIVV
jgi:hypothetical protein